MVRHRYKDNLIIPNLVTLPEQGPIVLPCHGREIVDVPPLVVVGRKAREVKVLGETGVAVLETGEPDKDRERERVDYILQKSRVEKVSMK